MMTQECIDFQRRDEVHAFARARVQAMGAGVQLALYVPRQVGALGQTLAQQPSGDVIGAALPGTVRIGKHHLDREPLYQGVDGRTIASPLEEVAFPVTGYGWTASRGSEI